MIKDSNIEWTGPTWNWLQGCVKKTIEIEGRVKLREECRNCYMYRDKRRYGKRPEVVVRSAPATFNKPLKLQKEVEQGLRPNFQDRLVFACSWSDWNNPEGDLWRPEAWDIVRQCPDLIFQILTKLPQRMNDHLPPFWDEIKDRCWVGVSCGYQEAAEQMIPELLKIPATTRFLSCEPLLGPLCLTHPADNWLAEYTDGEMRSNSPIRPPQIHWVIAGGESGPGARPCHPNWVRSLRDQCQASGVAFFMKQWGEWDPENKRTSTRQPGGWLAEDGHFVEGLSQMKSGVSYQSVSKVGKQAAGRMLDGREYSEFPVVAEKGA